MRPTDRLARALVDAAVELHRLRLWLEVPPDTPIVIRTPGEPHPVVVSVIGHLGSDYGLFVVRGEHALQGFRRYIATAGQSIETLDVLAVNMEPLGKIPPHLRGILEAAGIHARREAMVPLFFTRDANSEEVRAPSRSEQRLLLAAVRGLILTHAAGELVVKPLVQPSSRLLEITVEGEAREFRASSRTSRWGAPALDVDVPELDVPPDLPHTDEHWIAGAIDGREISARDLEGERILLVADARTDELIDQCAGPVDSAVHALALFSAAIRGDSDEQRIGFPAEVAFADAQLFDEVAPSLEAAGVRCRRIENYPQLAVLAELLRATGPHELLEEKDRFSEDQLPATLAGWKAADLRITRRLAELLEAKPQSLGRALSRYFGTEETAVEVLQELEHLQPLGAFTEWRMSDYRPTVRSKTFLEQRLLVKKLSRVERALIEARLAARVSIYRIVAVRPGEEIDLEDVFDGTPFTVQERALSGCDIEGFFFPLRIMQVADWHFLATAGPPISALQIDRVLDYLDKVRIEPSAAGLSRHAYVLGWLWASLLPRNQSLPKLCNTDGDPLSWHTATFRLADPAAAAKALTGRADVRFDEEDGDWTWWRAGGPSPGFGDNTTLGRLSILDDRLVLEVNSAARFERARKWLDALPGVRFERVTERAPGDPAAPLDDALPKKPESVSPEWLAAVRALQDEYYRRWLDLPVPALGNRSPRQACKDAVGKKRVEIMIRTMPAGGSPSGPIEPPREELLRELGIDPRK